MKPTLLVLAAGMGSRYGGLKQIDKLGPSGQTILQYSAFDAARAGFGRVVFVIRRDIEKDFNELQPYTQPEIQRANLAEVILRMKAFRLGEIETFPFLNPPSSQAIHAGYALL